MADKNGKLVPFQIEVLAAVPGKSRNGRNYTPELLEKAAPTWLNTPFIADHDYENCSKVFGVWTDTRYGVGKLQNGTEKTGLWFKGVGLMEQNLFDKVRGDPDNGIPPLIKGISIGGEGEGEMTSNGLDLKELVGAEASLTAFPGIPEAQVSKINQIREHYLGDQKKMSETKSKPIEETKIPVTEDSKKQDAEPEGSQAKPANKKEDPADAKDEKKEIAAKPSVKESEVDDLVVKLKAVNKDMKDVSSKLNDVFNKKDVNYDDPEIIKLSDEMSILYAMKDQILSLIGWAGESVKHKTKESAPKEAGDSKTVASATSMCPVCSQPMKDGECMNSECSTHKESKKPNVTEKVTIKEAVVVEKKEPITVKVEAPKTVETIGVGDGVSIKQETAAKAKEKKSLCDIYIANQAANDIAKNAKELVTKHGGNTRTAFQDWLKQQDWLEQQKAPS